MHLLGSEIKLTLHAFELKNNNVKGLVCQLFNLRKDAFFKRVVKNMFREISTVSNNTLEISWEENLLNHQLIIKITSTGLPLKTDLELRNFAIANFSYDIVDVEITNFTDRNIQPKLHDFSAHKYDTWLEEITLENPVLIEKIEKSTGLNSLLAKSALVEALRYLDLVHFSKKSLTPSIIVDLAWHEFVLCTQSYKRFCLAHFGRFIHHHPGGRTKQTINNFNKTINYYITYIGKPNEEFWGTLASDEWSASMCGTNTL